MTLNDMVVAALEQSQRGDDAQLINRYKREFTQYANEAVLDIAEAIGLFKTDTVTLVDGAFNISTLTKKCTKIISITQNSLPVQFDDGETLGEVLTDVEGSVKVKYQYIPDTLSNDTDTPSIPEQYHSLIPIYVAARFRSGGDPGAQQGSSIYFSLYNEMKRKLMKPLTSKKLINIW